MFCVFCGFKNGVGCGVSRVLRVLRFVNGGGGYVIIFLSLKIDIYMYLMVNL